jgi:hypothetical protein
MYYFLNDSRLCCYYEDVGVEINELKYYKKSDENERVFGTEPAEMKYLMKDYGDLYDY